MRKMIGIRHYFIVSCDLLNVILNSDLKQGHLYTCCFNTLFVYKLFNGSYRESASTLDASSGHYINICFFHFLIIHVCVHSFFFTMLILNMNFSKCDLGTIQIYLIKDQKTNSCNYETLISTTKQRIQNPWPSLL